MNGERDGVSLWSSDNIKKYSALGERMQAKVCSTVGLDGAPGECSSTSPEIWKTFLWGCIAPAENQDEQLMATASLLTVLRWCNQFVSGHSAWPRSAPALSVLAPPSCRHQRPLLACPAPDTQTEESKIKIRSIDLQLLKDAGNGAVSNELCSNVKDVDSRSSYKNGT